MKKIYHTFIKLLLKTIGLNFHWYIIFYVNIIYLFKFTEPCLQFFRTKRNTYKKFGSKDIFRYTNPDDIVIDFGANVGKISSLLLTLGYRVHAFEPDSRCITLLKRRFAKIESRKIKLFHCAVSNKTGKFTLKYGSLTTESNTLLNNKPGADGNSGSEIVNTINIQDILDQYKYIPFIKMDIEGAEYNVLDIMLKNKNLHKFGVCIVEVHSKQIPELQKEQIQLEKKIKEKKMNDRILLTWH